MLLLILFLEYPLWVAIKTRCSRGYNLPTQTFRCIISVRWFKFAKFEYTDNNVRKLLPHWLSLQMAFSASGSHQCLWLALSANGLALSATRIGIYFETSKKKSENFQSFSDDISVQGHQCIITNVRFYYFSVKQQNIFQQNISKNASTIHNWW